MKAHLNPFPFSVPRLSDPAAGLRSAAVPCGFGRVWYVRLFVILFPIGGLWAQHTVALLHPAPVPLHTDAPAADHAAAILPFDLSGGMMLVQASVDGRPGTFILDTGAPGIILNDREVPPTGFVPAAGIGGSVQLGVTQVDRFSWGSILLENQRAYTLDIRHLEEACGREILGLIGFEAFRQKILLIDYEGRMIKVLPDETTLAAGHGQPLRWIRFLRSGHLPVVKARLGGRTLYLGLDSGSEVNAIDRTVLEDLPPGSVTSSAETWLTGLDNRPELSRSVTLPPLTIRQDAFPAMAYAALPSAALQSSSDCTMHGLLGAPFFRQYKIAIDYRRNRLCLWP